MGHFPKNDTFSFINFIFLSKKYIYFHLKNSKILEIFISILCNSKFNAYAIFVKIKNQYKIFPHNFVNSNKKLFYFTLKNNDRSRISSPLPK